MSTPLSICIVIPTYNERENLPTLVRRIVAINIPNLRIVVVDDHSPDGTGVVADALAREFPVHVIHRGTKEGLGRAYLDAFRRILQGEVGAVPDVILHMDADLSHDPVDIPRLLLALAHADSAVGSRYVTGGKIHRWGMVRRLVSRVGNALAQRMLGLAQRDCTSGFRAYRRDALAKSIICAKSIAGYSFLLEMSFAAARLQCRVTEVPITFTERTTGRSKFTLNIFWGGIRTLISLYFRKRSTSIKDV